MRNRQSIKFLLLMTVLSLPLAACQSTAESAAHAERSQKIDAVLARAAEDAAAKGETTESLALLERMYKRDSANPENALKYASALREAERLNRAEIVLAPFAEKGEDATILTEYASIQSSLGNYETAEEYARKAVLLAPESAKTYHILGIALDAQGHHPQAETAFRKALDHWSGDPSPVLNNLGLNLAAQGFLDEAVDTLRKASSIAPGRKEIERNLRIVSALQVAPGKKRDIVPDPEMAPVSEPVAAPVRESVEAPAPAPAAMPPAEQVKVEPVAKEEIAVNDLTEADMEANASAEATHEPQPVTPKPFYRD